jgi:hypothetical protein
LRYLALFSLLPSMLCSCLLEPKRPRPIDGAPPRYVFGRWQTVGEGGLGIIADEKGSHGIWSLDDGSKPRQKALLFAYSLQPGGFVGVWHSTERRVNLSGIEGLRFMAKADPPSDIQLSLSDANRVGYVANFRAGTSWTEVHVRMLMLDNNPDHQPDGAVQGRPADWSHTTSMGFDALASGDGKFWIGPVFIED